MATQKTRESQDTLKKSKEETRNMVLQARAVIFRKEGWDID